MVDVGIVTGSKEQAQPLIVGKNLVYVHKDITLLPPNEDDAHGGETYQYHEYQYSKDEYIKMLAESNTSLEEQVTTSQMALIELYELML